ncbi:hypothetical protein CBM2634_P170010 [Cupriavidus taiwanensis]|uniref:Uncharacterized protein n=1 Tax=Cupriavidus taiwanensis TaxID=164546 RepID=A0A375JAI4_9BURK|nr:hypothetical protein CBM2634_P170010 [Cupriavidus taiwanensis]
MELSYLSVKKTKTKWKTFLVKHRS